MKTFSLIIPVYNEAKTLNKIVEKVLKLEQEQYIIENDIKLELILVDDCSTDNSYEIAQIISSDDNRIKIHHHKKNQGKGEH